MNHSTYIKTTSNHDCSHVLTHNVTIIMQQIVDILSHCLQSLTMTPDLSQISMAMMAYQ